jgi:hypothetical protein
MGEMAEMWIGGGRVGQLGSKKRYWGSHEYFSQRYSEL